MKVNLIFQNLLNKSFSYSKLISKPLHGIFIESLIASTITVSCFFVIFTNFFYLILSESSRSSFFIMTILYYTIFLIFFSRSQEKMCWINAWRIIASMADQHTFWNMPSIKNPRQSMSKNINSIKRKFSVSLFGSARIPFPASFSFFYFIPKSNCYYHMRKTI